MFAFERSATPMITGITTSSGNEGTAYSADSADRTHPPRCENAAQRATGTEITTESAMTGSAIHRWASVSCPISAQFEDSQVTSAPRRRAGCSRAA